MFYNGFILFSIFFFSAVEAIYRYLCKDFSYHKFIRIGKKEIKPAVEANVLVID